MIAAAILFASLASAPTPRCAALGNITRSMIKAKAKGVTEAEARQVVAQELDGDARREVNAIVWYVYTSNADNRTPPAKLVELVQRACRSSDTNALSQEAP